MQVYSLKEAARLTKIGVDTLKRACEEGLIKASKLPNRQWRVTESALEEALNSGIALPKAPKRAKGRNPQPEGLRKYREEHPGANRKRKSNSNG